ncbi:hypothetical protein BD410DRAFT_846594 [Rickenella mellea]|uniref:Uncharacterized protein n=1 Tax=Rickenella mellea TaxID=50990 RepID=A0A4Y7PEN6_9AGAM|nr:hypothetical protein BD410DRAFT_846594 [Rickenella mellea]
MAKRTPLSSSFSGKKPMTSAASSASSASPPKKKARTGMVTRSQTKAEASAASSSSSPSAPSSTPMKEGVVTRSQTETEREYDEVESMMIIIPETSSGLLFVPDPIAALTYEDAQDSTEFPRVMLTWEELESLDNVNVNCEGEGGFFHEVQMKRGKGKGKMKPGQKVEVLIHEWLYVAICLARAGYKVTYLTWSEFMDKVRDSRQHRYFLEFNCLIGGMDFSTDYLEPNFYGLSAAQAREYKDKIMDIRKKVKVWPEPDQLIQIGDKFKFIQRLEDIARNVTRSKRPQTTLLKRDDDIPSDRVVKRSNSGNGNSVFMPCDGRPPLTWDDLESPDTDMQWFTQSLVVPLRDNGEWRVILVGGKPLYTIHTLNQSKADRSPNWWPELVTKFYTLKQLSALSQRGRLATTKLFKPVGAHPEGVDEFYSFVTDTLNALAPPDEQNIEGNSSSSLRVFCRMDIGVFVDSATNQASYFVNEIEASMNAGVWNGLKGVDLVGDSFATPFSEWLVRTSPKPIRT